jgi:hypothetical protein
VVVHQYPAGQVVVFGVTVELTEQSVQTEFAVSQTLLGQTVSAFVASQAMGEQRPYTHSSLILGQRLSVFSIAQLAALGNHVM